MGCFRMLCSLTLLFWLFKLEAPRELLKVVEIEKCYYFSNYFGFPYKPF